MPRDNRCMYIAHVVCAERLARWTEKMAGGQGGRSDSPLARIKGLGRQQYVMDIFWSGGKVRKVLRTTLVANPNGGRCQS